MKPMKRSSTVLWFCASALSALFMVGCGGGNLGLANAPALGGPQVAPGRLQDAIANGEESCERVGDGSPLRGHSPPCSSRKALRRQVVLR